MNETMMREKVHQAVDNHCAHLRDDYWLAQRVIALAQEQERNAPPIETPRRRSKLSVGLIVAIVLTLMSVTAVAAVVLSVRQIVEERAIPMAQDTEGDRYTLEDTNLLVQLAKENGLVLSDNAMASIAKASELGEGYWKEELLMALAKAEFGDNLASWTLEQQKWFDDVCVVIGFIDEPEKGLPDEPDLASASALEAANAYLRNVYGTGDELLDDASYTVGIQYINGERDGEFGGMYWSIDYQPHTLELSEYWVYLDSAYEVLNASRKLGIVEGASFMEVYNRYRIAKENSILEWTQEELQAFREAIALCVPDQSSALYVRMMAVTYPHAGEAAIGREQAITLSADAFSLSEYNVLSAIYVQTDEAAVWRVHLAMGENHYLSDIDGQTGVVVYAGECDAPDISCSLVPQSIYETVLPYEPSVG